MKNRLFLPLIAATVMAAASCSQNTDNRLVILHTNDTHSQIEPGSDGLGGVMRRKAVIDSVRSAEKNVLLVDAGDAVQGTLYFYLYGGRVEQELMNLLGVDERILGNHEFDNGIDSLALITALAKSEMLSTNYNFDDTPLKGMFQPYSIKEYGGKKIGIIGLNLDPTGMIAKGNYDGLAFLPVVATANLTAKQLKEEKKVDAVIALTHIGYNPAGLVGDSVLATNSHDIDIIIGGHSHDTIDPTTEQGALRSHLTNLDGEDVLVVQAGKAGRKLGKIEINLDSLGLGAKPKYELIDIDGRYDGYTDPRVAAVIGRYKAGVDSLMHDWIGESPKDLSDKGVELVNYFTDFVYDTGRGLAPDVDLAIANKGGLRTPILKGPFSKGNIINMVPFKNFVTVIDVKGKDLLDVFDVMARTDGNGVSRNVRAVYTGSGKDAKAVEVTVDGKPVDPDKTYRVATIDYLAKGGDYMSGLTRGQSVVMSKVPVYDELITFITTGKGKGRVIGGDAVDRWSHK